MSVKDFFPITIDSEGSSQRIDAFLSRLLRKTSRSVISKWLAQRWILVNGKAVKPSYKLKPNDLLSLGSAFKDDGEEGATLPFTGPVPELLFEDRDFLVIHKPERLVVHPGAGTPMHMTLASWLREEALIDDPDSGEWSEELRELSRQGIVHRLDKDSSGLLVLARNPRAHLDFKAMIARRELHRFYWAIVGGSLLKRIETRTSVVKEMLARGQLALKQKPGGVWDIASLHGRDPRNPQRFCVAKDSSRKAISSLLCEISGEEKSLVEFKIQTGRTHQIRVHCQCFSTPILGDTLYGGESADRMYLHAHRIAFQHPRSDKVIDIQSESKSLQEALERYSLKASSKADEVLGVL